MPETPSIILLHGNDEYAISQHIEKLCADLDDTSTAEMNITRFDGRTGLDFQALNTSINTAPFLAQHRVMVLENPISAFTTPEARKKFIELLEKAQATTIIALAEYDELKRDHWLLKWAASHAGTGNTTSRVNETSNARPRASIHVYNMPKRWEMPRWVESETKKLGGRIDPDAAARLSEMVGEDTRIAVQELTKLLSYVNFERPITLSDVDQVSFVSAQGNVFDLVDALGQGDGRKAQHVLHQLMEDADAFEFWGMIIRQFRLLLQARELLDSNATITEIQKALGLHEFVAQKVISQAKRFSLSALESIYHKLLEMDEGAKTSQVPLDLALEMLVIELVKK